jgi:hypothetical protein
MLFLLLTLGIYWVRPETGAGSKDPSAVRSTDGIPRDQVALVQPDFELPEISLREVTMASFAGEATDVRWEGDFEAARSLAAYSCCPILYEVYDEQCPVAEWVNGECMKNEEIVRATRNYICIRRTSKNHLLKVPPKVTPAFFILSPDGEVHQEFGGMVTRDAILSELSKNAKGDHWISCREFSKYRRMLEEALEAYRKKAFNRAQEKLGCFSTCCCNCGLKKAGIFDEYQQILAAMQGYVAEKHTFARRLVKNDQIDRARKFYGKIIEEFRGLPIETTLRDELAALDH